MVACRLVGRVTGIGSNRTAFALLALGALLRLWFAPGLGYLGIDADLLEHKQAVQRMTELGVASVYDLNERNDPALTGRDWDGGFFMNNLPVILYLRFVVCQAYERVVPGGLALWDHRLNALALERSDLAERLSGSRGLTVALKLPGIAADVLLAGGIWAYVRMSAGARAGVAACAAYSLNPGAIFNTAHWGQHDSVWILLVVLALAASQTRCFATSGAMLALACLTKPQAWALVPLVAWRWLGRGSTAGVARGSLGAAVTASLIVAPFALEGRLVMAARAVLASTVGGEPFVSCNAANFWWLASGGDGYGVRDDAPLLGPLSARHLGLALVALGVALVIRWTPPAARFSRVALGAASVTLCAFSFGTELHENHAAAALPLLLLSLPEARWLAGVAALASITFLVNLVWFDPAALDPLARLLGPWITNPAVIAVAAAANLGVLAVSLGFLGRAPSP